MFKDTFNNRRVLVTGHTGFKGAWLCEWLLGLGASVHGLSLDAGAPESLFAALGLASRLDHGLGDVRDADRVRACVRDCRPDFVFHLAAQPLVRRSYEDPLNTFSTNVLGTAQVLEALRLEGAPCAVVAVTTDKCYENREWLHSYREEDPLGGHDPYSASKGAAEIVISSYRRSFFNAPDSPVRLASARAGNVIGGGDWSPDRIVPDCMRALRSGQAIRVRHPWSTRPWQHVLEPLAGYLWLAARMHRSPAEPDIASAYNFGPTLASNRCVGDLVREILKSWPGEWETTAEERPHHEASLLNLAIDKAWHRLGWRPVWSFEECIEKTVSWYRSAHEHKRSAGEVTTGQIDDYCRAASEKGLSWTQ